MQGAELHSEGMEQQSKAWELLSREKQSMGIAEKRDDDRRDKQEDRGVRGDSKSL